MTVECAVYIFYFITGWKMINEWIEWNHILILLWKQCKHNDLMVLKICKSEQSQVGDLSYQMKWLAGLRVPHLKMYLLLLVWLSVRDGGLRGHVEGPLETCCDFEWRESRVSRTCKNEKLAMNFACSSHSNYSYVGKLIKLLLLS